MLSILKKMFYNDEKKPSIENVFFSYKKSNDPGRNFLSVESLNGEFLFSSLHLLPHIYPIFTCVDTDPYSEYGSGSTKLVNNDPI